MAKKGFSKTKLLKRLPAIKYEKPDKRDQDRFDQISLAGAMLLLAEINPEQEYGLCRSLAEHLLGKVPEPDDADMGEE